MMSITDKECQRFFRAAILVLKHGTSLLQNLLDLKLQQMHVSLPELLHLHRHELFHAWQKHGCCACPTVKASYFAGYLITPQYEDLYVFVKTPSRVCQHLKTSVHGTCSCRWRVRKGVLTRSLDISVSSMLLLNFNEFNLDDETIEAIWELRRLRHEIIKVSSEMCLTEENSVLLWNRIVSSLTNIANLLSTDCHNQNSETIRTLRDDPLHLYSAKAAVATIRHGNQRELSFLKDLQDVMAMVTNNRQGEDLQDVMAMVTNNRQGEVLAMLDLGLEIVSSTLGQPEPTLKEMQKCKFLYHDGKFTDLAKCLSGPWMKNLLKSRIQVHEQTEIWRERLWSADPLKSKISSTLSLKSCGENVKLSNDRRFAVWNFMESDGVTFSHRPMDHLEHLILEVTGSGEVAIGAIGSDPKNHEQSLSSFSTYPELKTAIVVKCHESLTQVKVTRDADQLIIFCDDKRYVMSIEPGQKPWMVFYLRFGDVRMELHSEAQFPMKFHEITGNNVQMVSGTKRLLCLKQENPRSVCRLSRRLRCGEEVTMNIRQERSRDVRAIPCHLVLGISADGLQNGSLHDDQPFTSASREWLVRKHLDETLCEGRIRLSVTNKGVLTLVGAKGVSESVKLSASEQRMGVAAVFEMFRTELEIVSYKIKQ